ncbi:DUF4834 family protein [Mesonia sp. JHPTF-M18]|uniref:DUF4834 family protein n=2 Tax=Mesonia aestuariivivens TaxID=2796128 RepID=A0ABS6VYK7_9FLAO|nr:DUF4834 family protein [Mesonia aestuariivivens]
MQEASLVGLFKTILIILLIYFGLKIIFKWFGPLILKYFMKKVGEKAFKGFTQNGGFTDQREQESKADHIGKSSTKTKEKKKPVGEYIDYEEID